MLFSCHLEARMPEEKLARAYHVVVPRDLFELYTVDVTFGRIGRPGRTRRYTVKDSDAVRPKLREVFKRRLSAPRRVRVACLILAVRSFGLVGRRGFQARLCLILLYIR